MITLQKPTWEDVLGIQSVIYETWLATYPNKKFGITAEDIEERFKDRFSETQIKKRFAAISALPKNKIFLVAKDDEKVVGVCRAERGELNNQLTAIYILPAYQSKGIGKKLWKECLEFFEDKKDVIVYVATYNANAISFYQNLGFIDTGKRILEDKFKMPISGAIIPEMEMKLIRKQKN